MARYVGLDLGTTYTRIWTQDKGVILRCPSVAAVNTETDELVALGERARLMIGKTPENITAYRPVKESVVADYQVASRMVSRFFANKQLRSTFRRPVVLVGTPYRITEVEQLALENTVLDAGAKAVSQLPSVFAAAAGAGLRVESPRGCMVLSMGGGRIETAIISSGGIISATSVKGGGERVDLNIMNYLQKTRELIVGESTAELLRLKIGIADPRLDRGEMTAYGRHARTGLAAGRTVSSEEICGAIAPVLDNIGRVILATLEGVPPEISADIHRNGVVLCGGASLLPGLCQALGDRTGLDFYVAENPLDCVIVGLGMVLDDPGIWNERLEARVH